MPGLASLRTRYACAIESAALANPNMNVFMIFVEKTAMNKSKVFSALKEYQNVFLVGLEVEEFSKGTIAELWVGSKTIYNTKHRREHFSDFLRFLLLWKFENLTF